MEKTKNVKDKKIWYKKWWIWTGFLAFFIGTFCVAIFCGNTNISTMVAGWISGVATIVLGGIAILQNKSYKNENKINDEKRKEEIDSVNRELITIQGNIACVVERLEDLQSGRYVPYIKIFNQIGQNQSAKTYECAFNTTISTSANSLLRIQNLGNETIQAIKLEKYFINSVEYNVREDESADFSLTVNETALINIYQIPNESQEIDMAFKVTNILGDCYSLKYNLKTKWGQETKYIGKMTCKPTKIREESSNN